MHELYGNSHHSQKGTYPGYDGYTQHQFRLPPDALSIQHMPEPGEPSLALPQEVLDTECGLLAQEAMHPLEANATINEPQRPIRIFSDRAVTVEVEVNSTLDVLANQDERPM